MEKTFFIAVLIWNSLVTTVGWRVVFKVLAGTSLSPYSSVYDLWLSSGKVKDTYNDYLALNDDLAGSNPPVYKSDIVNSWQPINQIKVALYENDTNSEVMSVVFNNTPFSNKLSWFESSNLATDQKYTDLETENVGTCSLVGNNGRLFEILSDNSTECGQTAGWLVIVDKGGTGQCTWDTGVSKPFFRYSSGTTANLLKGSLVADVFLVFVDECAERPCHHGGTCVNVQGSAVCTCPDQYYGFKCEYVCPCRPGKCIRVTPETKPSNDVFTLGRDTLYCSCPAGFGGRHCRSNIDDCAGSPCENGGTCTDGIAKFTCECPVGYYGRTCSGKEHDEDNSKVGATVAVAIIIPITVILVGAIVGYCIYIKRNPQGYGRATTYKHMALARHFVRRSIRRMSGRKARQARDVGETTKDKRQIISKNTPADTSHVNHGFQGGFNDIQGSQDAEYIDLSPHDQAVMSDNHRKDKAPKTARLDADHYQKYPDSSSLGSSRSGSLHQELPPMNPHYYEPDVRQRYTPESAESRDVRSEDEMHIGNRTRNTPTGVYPHGPHPNSSLSQSPHSKASQPQSPQSQVLHTQRNQTQVSSHKSSHSQSPVSEDRPIRPSRRPHQMREQSKPSDTEYI